MIVPAPDDQTLIIGSQLRFARESMGLSLADAASSLGLIYETLAGWEEGKSEPSVDALLQMSELYRRSLDYFLRPVGGAPIESAFRVTNARQLPDLGPEHRQVLVEFEELCRSQCELEEMLGVVVPPEIEKISAAVAPTDLARQQRARFDLGMKPVPHLRALLEGARVKVFHLPVPNSRFSGFSWWHDTYGPGALINSKDSFGRRNFTLAHELAHLLVGQQSVICDLLMDVDDERYANIFAAHFLMPTDAMQEAFEKLLSAKESPEDSDFGRMASHYGVSLEALGRRLEETEMLPSGTTDRMIERWERGNRSYGRSHNPQWRRRTGERFLALAGESYTRGLISLSKLASLLGVDSITAADYVKSGAE